MPASKTVRTFTPKPVIQWPLADTSETCQQLGVGPAVLKSWRTNGAITYGIHWYMRPGTHNRILWNLDLMRDFVACGSQDVPSHKTAIERYLASLPSSIRA